MLLSYLNHYGTNCVLSCQVIWDSFATHMDCGPPGSSVHGIFQARTLQWVAISSTRVQHCSGLPFLPSGFFLTQGSNPRFLCLFYWQIRSLTQSCLTLGDPMNHSMPGLPVHHQLPRSSLRLMSIESVMPSSHLILCRPLLLLPPIPPSIRVFSNKSTLRMR